MAEVKYIDLEDLTIYHGLLNDEINDSLSTKADKNHTHAVATEDSAGFMSAEDKVKLDAIASDATKVSIDSELSSTSTNPVQNKVINSALSNKADASHTHTIANVTGLQSALDAKLDDSQKGVANGLAELGADGLVPSSQLPSYVDDVLEYSAKTNFPKTGETGKIYVDTATNLTYRWGGSSYVEISASLAIGTTSSTAFRGDYGNAAYQHSQKTGSGIVSDRNPHGLSPSDIGAASSSHTHDDRYYTETEIDSKVSELNAAINGKADSSHKHTIANVTGLQDALDGKAASSHNHASSDVTVMTGYTKPSSSSAISATDSLNTAIGKLETLATNTATVASAVASYLPEKKVIKTATTADIQALFA